MEESRRGHTGSPRNVWDDDRIPDTIRRHILDGDGSRGGHRFTSREPNKTVFPERWDDPTWTVFGLLSEPPVTAASSPLIRSTASA